MFVDKHGRLTAGRRRTVSDLKSDTLRAPPGTRGIPSAREEDDPVGWPLRERLVEGVAVLRDIFEVAEHYHAVSPFLPQLGPAGLPFSAPGLERVE
jgi:hypothetical protein